MPRPSIETAIPQHRYQIGEYSATLLADIVSTDAKEYNYSLAVIVDGAKQPKLYVTLEKNRGAASAEGSHCMRLLGEGLEQEVGSSDEWRSADAFAATAIAVVMQLLGLQDERPLRLS